MNWITFSIGALAFAYGLFTLYLRLNAPEKLGRLTTMKKFYGPRMGNGIHVFRYTFMPIFFGIIVILAGIRGVSFWGL
jgi:hypothetical protein